MVTYFGQRPPSLVFIEAMDAPEWGTHTIPSHAKDIPAHARGKFNTYWTSGKPTILKDAAFKARRLAKHAQHERNAAERVQANIDRSNGVVHKAPKK
jgi:hypothetical protein